MRFQKPVTKEEWKEYATGSDSSSFHLDFTVTEMTEFLMKLGYEIHAVDGVVKVRDTESDGGGGLDYRGDPYDKQFRQIIAIKPGDPMPERLDGDYGHQVHIWVAFRREMKAQMLRRLSSPESLV